MFAFQMKKLLFALLLASVGASAQTKRVRIETDYGPVVIALYDGTPLHRDNMLQLSREKFFDSLLWHRVIPGFVIQGGDPQSKGAAAGATLGNGERPGAGRIPAEIEPQYYHKRGAVGMARDQNPEKASSNCQFYIVVGKPLSDAEIDNAQKRAGITIPDSQRAVYRTAGGTAFLDGNYTVFGEVVSGMEAVEKIAAAPRDRADRPTADLRMISVRVEGEKAAKKKRRRFLGIF